MSASAEDRLMRYLDGETTPEESREVEAWLEASGEGRSLASDLDLVGDVVRLVAEERGRAADGIADAVMGRIEKEGLSVRRVNAPAPASLGAARRKKHAAGRPGVLVPAIGLSLAAAAAVVLFLRSPNPTTVKPVASVAASETALPSEPPPIPEETAARDDGPGAAIESVDFGAQNGTIFMVASGPQTTPVVWLVDDGDAS